MKLTVVLLIASLAANGVLAARWLSLKNHATPATVTKAEPARFSANPTQPKAEPLPIGQDFLKLTPAELRDRLQASGLPHGVVEQLVHARIAARLHARQRELVADTLKSAPPWRFAALRNDRFSVLTPEQRKELRDLEAEVRDESLRLLGPGQLDRDGLMAFKYGFVSPAKAVLLDALDRDYASLATQLKEETRNLRTPADKERGNFIKTEQERDLAALLTPAEREAYDLRASATALNVNFQTHIAAFQPTEAEYRALFALQKAVDAGGTGQIVAMRPAAPGATMMMSSGPPMLNNDGVRAALGEARHAEWVLAGQPYYQSLTRLASGSGIPAEKVRAIGNAITETLNSSWRVAEDTNLSVTQKKAALTDLATQVRAQATTQLGSTLADSYLRSMRWLDALGNGTAVKVEGNVTSFRPVDPPKKPGPPGS